MSGTSERVAVLLGAGASREAGLPLSGELTNWVIDHLASDPAKAKLSAAFNQICSAIIAHRGADGIAPTEPLNIERVVSSIRLLQNRRHHEAAPFVVNWLTAAESSGAGAVSRSTAREISNQLGLGNIRPFPGHLEKAITSAVQEVIGGSNDRLYRDLECSVIDAVAARIRDIKDTSYLAALAELAGKQGSLDVATLNYDRTVETVCAARDVPIGRGVEDWWPGTPLAWVTEGINLYKIHGSVDWWISSREQSQEDSHQYLGREHLSNAALGRDSRPAIVLGDRGKLESQPITLELMAAFQSALEKASRLVVCGYSFGDEHINRIIANWVDRDQTRSVTVLSLEQDFRRTNRARPQFVDALLSLTYDGASGARPRVNGVADGARAGLRRAIDATPVPHKDLPIHIEADRVDNMHIIRVRNGTTEPVFGLSASAQEPGQPSPSMSYNRFEHNFSLREIDGGHAVLFVSSARTLAPGDTWDLVVQPRAGSEAIAQAEFVLEATPLVGHMKRTVLVSWPAPNPG